MPLLPLLPLQPLNYLRGLYYPALFVVVIINIIIIKSRVRLYSNNESASNNMIDKTFEKNPIAIVSIVMSALSYIGFLALQTLIIYIFRNLISLFDLIPLPLLLDEMVGIFLHVFGFSEFLPIVFSSLIVTFVNIVIYGENKLNHHIYSFKEENDSIDDYNLNNLRSSAYCDITKHILLLLFTFGIWFLIWIYRTTEYLNHSSKADRYNSASQLLLCMFVPFYTIFWFYKQGQRTDSLAKSMNIDSDIGNICLITGIFIPFVAAILIQDKINAISKSAEL